MVRTASSDRASASGRIQAKERRRGRGPIARSHTREGGGGWGHRCLLFSEAGARIFIGLADAITRQVRYEQVSEIEGKGKCKALVLPATDPRGDVRFRGHSSGREVE